MNRVSQFLLVLAIAQVIPAWSQSAATPQDLTAQGNTFLRQREYDKARESFEQAIGLDPKLANAYLGLGMVLNGMRRASEAVAPLKKATELDPKSYPAYLNLGIVYLNLRRYDDAVSAISAAREISPDRPESYTHLGLVMTEMRRFDDAEKYYRQAVELNPKDYWDLFNIGLNRMQQGRFADAVEPLVGTLKMEPRYPKALYHLSNAYTFTGRYTEAIETWTKYLEGDPRSGDALSGRAWCYLYLGNSGRDAAADALKFLSLYGWQIGSSPYQGLVAIIGYRSAGMDAEAQAVITNAQKKLTANSWGSSLIRYYSGDISGDELLKLAANNDQRTEAHAYIGMDLILKTRPQDARSHFEWVKQNGNRRFVEYPLAIAELGRLQN